MKSLTTGFRYAQACVWAAMVWLAGWSLWAAVSAFEWADKNSDDIREPDDLDHEDWPATLG